MSYSREEVTGSPVARDDIMMVLEGVEKSYPRKTAFPDRVWIGAIQYTILKKTTTAFFRCKVSISGERNSRERRLLTANAFDPVFVNRNSQVVVCVTPAASPVPVQAQTTSCR